MKDMKTRNPKFGLKVPAFGTWATCDEDVIRVSGDASELFYAVSSMASWYDEETGVVRMREIMLKYEPGTEKPYRGKTIRMVALLQRLKSRL